MSKSTKPFFSTTTGSNSKTLFPAKKIGKKLIISEFNTDTRNICVISDGLEYREGKCYLKIGDDVYIVTKKTKYCTFLHFRVTSLDSKNNCKLIFKARLYNLNKLTCLPKEKYRTFTLDFKRRHDL